MAADSVALAEDFIVPRIDSKIFANGEFLIGYAGSYRFGQILKFAEFPEPPKILPENSASEKLPIVSGDLPADWKIAEKFMITEFVPALRGAVAGEDIENGCCIVAFDKYMFVIDLDTHVAVYRDNFAALGLAEREALCVNDALQRGGVVVEDPTIYLTNILESIKRYTVIDGPWTYGRT